MTKVEAILKMIDDLAKLRSEKTRMYYKKKSLEAHIENPDGLTKEEIEMLKQKLTVM